MDLIGPRAKLLSAGFLPSDNSREIRLPFLHFSSCPVGVATKNHLYTKKKGVAMSKGTRVRQRSKKKIRKRKSSLVMAFTALSYQRMTEVVSLQRCGRHRTETTMSSSKRGSLCLLGDTGGLGIIDGHG